MQVEKGQDTNRVILVTNDDGYKSSGMEALIEMVKPLGRVVVVAPEEGNSGMSHAITIKVPLRMKHATFPRYPPREPPLLPFPAV
ncbi:MAG TPA: 5'/3'-nucleotidase SurE [Tenuifilaceae bacterium]|nr:5'/3'-nucleotidase SurE [Tenuifilaceae bacterium]